MITNIPPSTSSDNVTPVTTDEPKNKISAGKLNTLRIVKQLDFGVYLDGGALGEILMPTKWVPEGKEIGDQIDAFIYFDSSDRPIATTIKPKACVDEVAFLMCKEVNTVGAFLDWGLDKDLLVPYREQKARMLAGKHYIVYVYKDTMSDRIAASVKVERFLSNEDIDYQPGEEVNIMIWSKTELGFKVIINNKQQGIIYANEIFKPVQPGRKLKAYISKVREDGKIDVSLEKPGYEKVDELSQIILNQLIKNNGFLDVGDKSEAGYIYHLFNMSKKNFKKSIGTLFKQKKIMIEESGIRLVTD
ncbi:MAG: GntR family transcriptional regulator [Bacteroidales bacterium]|nr:GntR family transcriptional regulator [Bacteroidales bacterium]